MDLGLPFFTGRDDNEKSFEVLRWANAGDLPALRKLVIKGHPSEPLLHERLPKLLNPGLIRVLAMQWGEEQPEIIAFSAAEFDDHDDSEYRLITIVVREDMQGKGIGRRMMNDTVFHAREKAKRPYLTTMVPEYKTYEDDPEFQLGWYQSMQFSASGLVIRDGYFRDGSRYDGFQFERHLT